MISFAALGYREVDMMAQSVVTYGQHSDAVTAVRLAIDQIRF